MTRATFSDAQVLRQARETRRISRAIASAMSDVDQIRGEMIAPTRDAKNRPCIQRHADFDLLHKQAQILVQRATYLAELTAAMADRAK